MFNQAEKAYCEALLALRNKDYRKAADCFDEAMPQYMNNKEFVLLMETNRLLLAVKDKLAKYENEEIEVMEAFAHGKETKLR